MNRGLIEGSEGRGDGKTGVSELPRFMNRGLIEGPSGIANHPRDARLPRFMNRGLIEVAVASR